MLLRIFLLAPVAVLAAGYEGERQPDPVGPVSATTRRSCLNGSTCTTSSLRKSRARGLTGPDRRIPTPFTVESSEPMEESRQVPTSGEPPPVVLASTHEHTVDKILERGGDHDTEA